MSALPPVRTAHLSFTDRLTQNDELVEDEFSNVEIECDECNGTGIITIDSKTDYRFTQHLRSIYDQQIKQDSQKLEAWNRIMREEAQSCP